MLDRLPLELLDHVLDLLPPPILFNGFEERRCALHACCHVSKKVAARATAFLHRDLLVDANSRLGRLPRRLREKPAAGGMTRSLYIQKLSESVDLDRTGLISGMFESLPSLRRLHCTLADYESIELGILQKYLPRLDTLQLDYLDLREPAPTFILPSLVSLSFNQTTISLTTAQVLASPITFPFLKAFAYTAEEYQEDNEAVVEHLVGAFSKRLDVVQLHLEDRYLSPTLVLPDVDSTVCTTRLGNLLPTSTGLDSLRPPSLRLYLVVVPDLDNCEILTDELTNHRPWMRHIYLPAFLRPSSLSIEHEYLLPPLHRLLRHLATQNVDVHWYDSEVENQYTVSPSFWRDAKARKEQRRVEV